MRTTAIKLTLAAVCFLPFVGCTDEEVVDDDGEEAYTEEVDLVEEDVPVVDDAEPFAAGTVNNSPDFLVVYNNNIENLVTCTGNHWDKLFAYVKAQSKTPDIFIVQQISNAAQLKALYTRMTNELAGSYTGVIAIANPGSMGYPEGTCAANKNRQTNAVIYRTDRFTYEATTRWRSDAPKNKTGACQNLVPTSSSQDRVENVAIRLYDKVAKQRVTAAAIHWPTGTWAGPDCADENMREANAAVDSLGGTLKIVAGDANTSKGSQGWWNDAIADGFRDPIAETCPSSGCPDSTSTLGSRRIDYMLVKGGHGFSGAKTISESSTGGKYSDHRALRANVKY